MQEITVDTEVNRKQESYMLPQLIPFSLAPLENLACFVGIMMSFPSGILNHSLFFIDLI